MYYPIIPTRAPPPLAVNRRYNAMFQLSIAEKEDVVWAFVEYWWKGRRCVGVSLSIGGREVVVQALR